MTKTKTSGSITSFDLIGGRVAIVCTVITFVAWLGSSIGVSSVESAWPLGSLVTALIMLSAVLVKEQTTYIDALSAFMATVFSLLGVVGVLALRVLGMIERMAQASSEVTKDTIDARGIAMYLWVFSVAVWGPTFVAALYKSLSPRIDALTVARGNGPD